MERLREKNLSKGDLKIIAEAAGMDYFVTRKVILGEIKKRSVKVNAIKEDWLRTKDRFIKKYQKARDENL